MDEVWPAARRRAEAIVRAYEAVTAHCGPRSATVDLLALVFYAQARESTNPSGEISLAETEYRLQLDRRLVAYLEMLVTHPKMRARWAEIATPHLTGPDSFRLASMPRRWQPSARGSTKGSEEHAFHG